MLLHLIYYSIVPSFINKFVDMAAFYMVHSDNTQANSICTTFQGHPYYLLSVDLNVYLYEGDLRICNPFLLKPFG